MPRGTQDTASLIRLFRLQDYHPLRSAFPCQFGYKQIMVLPQSCNPEHSTHKTIPLLSQLSARFGLLPFRSPLLRESLLISLPPGTEMFHFPGFASLTYLVQLRMMRFITTPGCPIRIPTDLRSLATPRGFSQPAASFIAP